MNRNKSTVIVLLILSLASVSFPQVNLVKAEPKTIVVPDDYGSIQEAIDNASEGDTIFIKKRIYYENLEINKSLSLVGEDRESTIIDGGKIDAVVNITQNRVNISGFTLRNSGAEDLLKDASVYLSNVKYSNVSGNRIIGSRHGIIIRGSSSNIIQANKIDDNNVGLYIRPGSGATESNNNEIQGNEIVNNSHGISIYQVDLNIINFNNITGNEEDVILNDSHMNNFVGNNISNSNVGIVLAYANDNTFYLNNLINNTKDVSDTHFSDPANLISLSENIWDNNVEGNYWDTYTGIDNNGDGIGDTPYIINEHTQDNYPLMKAVEIPEFPSWSIISIVFTLTLVILIFKTKLKKKALE